MRELYTDNLLKKLYELVISKKDDNISLSYEAGVQWLFEIFKKGKENGHHLFFIGNGGSAAIATHMTADFNKNGGMKTINLYDIPTITCLGNDYGYESIFAKQVYRLGCSGDILVAISSSGNSRNIVNAISAAIEKDMKVITLSGFQADNTIRSMGDINVYVPVSHYGIVESIHNLILQQLVDMFLEYDGLSE